jgi:hypothetical protein
VELILDLQELPVAAGNYLFSFSLHSADHRDNYHRLDYAYSITVLNEDRFEGVCRIPCRWERPSVQTGG